MKPEAIDTITRHLKGIVAALEKEKTPVVFTFYGKKLEDCTDTELIEAYKQHFGNFYVKDYFFRNEALLDLIRKRGLYTQIMTIVNEYLLSGGSSNGRGESIAVLKQGSSLCRPAE